MGVGLGANERLITLSAGLLILLILVFRGLTKTNKIEDVYNISIKTKTLELDQIIKTVKNNCKRIDLRRFDKKVKTLNVLLFVEFETYDNLKSCIEAFETIDKDVEINFVSVRSLG